MEKVEQGLGDDGLNKAMLVNYNLICTPFIGFGKRGTYHFNALCLQKLFHLCHEIFLCFNNFLCNSTAFFRGFAILIDMLA